MNSYQGDFGAHARAQGLCSSLLSVVFFLISPAIGSLSDAVGRVPLLYIGPLSDLVQRLVTLPLMTARSEAIARILFGSLAGATSGIWTTALADIYSDDPTQLAVWQSRLQMGSTVSTMVMPMISSSLASRSLRLPLYISAALCVLNMALIRLFVSETLPPEDRTLWRWSSSNPFSLVQLFCNGGRLRTLCTIAMVDRFAATATRTGGSGAVLDICAHSICAELCHLSCTSV